VGADKFRDQWLKLRISSQVYLTFLGCRQSFAFWNPGQLSIVKPGTKLK
jgi:hypothetical protein